MGKIKYTVFCVLLLLPALCRAQQEADDFGIWQTIDITTEPSDRWNFGVVFEHRSKNNAKDMDCALVMPHISYKITDWLSTGLQAEYITDPADKYLTLRPNVTASYASHGFKFSLRQLLYCEYGLGRESWISRMRTRAKINYTIPGTNLKPYSSYEYFYTDVWVRSRLRFGFEYSFGKHSGIEAYYMRHYYPQRDFTRHVAGVCYTFNI